MRESEIPEVPLMDGAVPHSLLRLSIDRRTHTERFGGDRLKTWGAQGAVNCLVIWKKLPIKIENGDIIPFYAGYMAVEKPTSPGFAMEGVCFVYEPSTAGERDGRQLKQSWKAPENNIYTDIGRCLIAEVDGGAASRLRAFLDTTFYDNAYA